jgi:WD40 repeat protein
MEAREKTRKAIVPAKSKSLAVRSAAIVARGLRDVARDSHWLSKKVFSGRATSLAVSPAGQVCAVSAGPDHGSSRVFVHELELKVAPFELPVRDARTGGATRPAAAFGFSPDGRHLIATHTSWPRELHVFDLHAKRLLRAFEPFSEFPSAFAWSHVGNYFAMSSRGAEAQIRVWEAATERSRSRHILADTSKEFPLAGVSVESGPSEPLANQFADEEAAAGFGRVAFSLDENTLATVVEIEGEWADDSIQLLEMPMLKKKRLIQAQGHITDISWAFDGRLIYCSGGQAFQSSGAAIRSERLPFGAELCTCHPRLPLCVCFSSWLKDSAKEKLFAVNLDTYKVFDELPAQGIADLGWSADGCKAYALTGDGIAYIYEPRLV